MSILSQVVRTFPDLRKRRISNILLTVGSLLSVVPQTAPIGIALTTTANLLGTVGVAHAAIKDRLKEDRPATVGALIGTAALIAAQVSPGLAPVLTQAAVIAAAASTGSFLLAPRPDGTN